MLILASASPRRRELMELLGIDFKVIPSTVDERIDPSLCATEQVMMLARSKAADISRNYQSDIVIGADTLVFLDGKPLGKPVDNDSARKMLVNLSGRTHSVFTGVAIAQKGTMSCFAEETIVDFFSLSSEEINKYVDTGEPLDKAGAYAIQQRGALFVKGIRGDYFNVMGLPIARLSRELLKF